ncbi:Lin1244/Lin1753 domain-containing protein [Aliarcobacter cibarius]|uniref:DUF4373 domain-containing protein n=1 Tax=Aliarcobacter cibarius TaxID=255507 RepID=A0A5J6RJH3_9BACT|nr:Lin1244/Lin1753 domain-containing protein [Aliarcobacter cibarius]QEZ90045.1 DUF4373 domain-containing protein [Aliarcobacter cibarius]QKJ28048.1 DUF4373 domain-containing protein [Aliarcobacter cibarius]TLT01337.1 DUF4373 domain-containing protein [Aliarcobacter cibarius]TLT01742.1 DUF4373 domain-containing protein [Aliarcobacter cibarius]
MEKIPPNFLFPTNFRNGKNVKRLIKDFNIQGYGIAVYLLETLAETDGHKYPINDIDLLSDEMKVSVPIINTVISSYGLFEIIEEANGNQFISIQLNKWLEPYYTKVDKLSRAGKISALKKKQKQEEQLLVLSQIDSSKHMLNSCTTINKLINKRNKEISNNASEKNDAEKFEKLNTFLLAKQISKDKQKQKYEDLAQASKENQIICLSGQN